MKRILLLFMVISSLIFSQENVKLKEKAKKIYENNKDAVVMMKIVIGAKAVFQGQEMPEQENKIEIPATVIDGNTGLAVSSYLCANPIERLQTQMEERGMTVESQIKDCKMRLNDGKEIPAKVVLKDKDSDLVFFLPEKLENKIPAITMPKEEKKVDIFDDVAIISKESKELNYEPEITFSKISAVIKKPRIMYSIGEMIPQDRLGCPVLDFDKGDIIGILLTKVSQETSLSTTTIPTIVIPIKDITELAKQIKIEEKK
jgi:hypothetical protein